MNKKLAICVPYRNREAHLNKFVPYLSNFLLKRKIEHKFFICHQADKKLFNRGKTKNIAFDIAKQEGFDYFAFHDIDMLPEDDNCDYSYPVKNPIHTAVYISDYDYNLPSQEYFGGCVIFTKEQFEKVNGYFNDYWGWGSEDDDLFWRCKQMGMVDEKYMEGELNSKNAAIFNGKNSRIKIPSSNTINKSLNNNYSILLLAKANNREDVPDFLIGDKKSKYIHIPLLSRGKYQIISFNNSQSFAGHAWKNPFKFYYSWSKRYKEQWSYILLTINEKEKKLRFYINGVESNIKLGTGSGSPINTTTPLINFRKKPFYLGYVEPIIRSKNSQYFKGEIARTCIWDRSLNNKEISNMFNNIYMEPPTEGLIIDYSFDNIKDNIIIDKSPNKNNGIITGCKITKKNIKIPLTILPYRSNGKYKCLPHEHERIVYGPKQSKFFKMGNITARNENIFVNKMRKGRINFTKHGLSDLKYEIISKKSIFNNHVMIDVKC